MVEEMALRQVFLRIAIAITIAPNMSVATS
jgi:hypothetical protein